ncbi:hypothetical protein PHET_03780 [Paragonimus heterotremus]|uniref:Uncharacterized protein n=1 Tax=Paragonimus heterotremus TaxID=100268 RepID=A0A8J4T2P1_9TREM|nr:hypothetical protein PHET_03780 [Paragonimus heterotremus]
MIAISPMRMMFLVTLAIAVILGVVVLSIDSTIHNIRTDKEAAYIAFNIIGIIFLITSLVLMLFLLLLCGDRYKPMMLSIIVCTAFGSKSVPMMFFTGSSVVCYITASCY